MKHLDTLIAHYGYRVATWSPGDGVRYRIVPLGEDYFSAPSPFTVTARGGQQAELMVRAFLLGLDMGAAPARRIRELLSGAPWNADTLNAVAEVLRDSGYAITDDSE